jgi:hypothetical protein
VPEVYGDHKSWKNAVGGSDVRLQFDPDHDPSGAPVERRAIQLGLRGSVLASYAREWLIEIEDISEFVRDQQQNVRANLDRLVTPREKPYAVRDHDVAERLALTAV